MRVVIGKLYHGIGWTLEVRQKVYTWNEFSLGHTSHHWWWLKSSVLNTIIITWIWINLFKNFYFIIPNLPILITLCFPKWLNRNVIEPHLCLDKDLCSRHFFSFIPPTIIIFAKFRFVYYCPILFCFWAIMGNHLRILVNLHEIISHLFTWMIIIPIVCDQSLFYILNWNFRRLFPIFLHWWSVLIINKIFRAGSTTLITH